MIHSDICKSPSNKKKMQMHGKNKVDIKSEQHQKKLRYPE